MDSYLIHYSGEEKMFAQNMENAIQRVSSRSMLHLTDFFDPRQQQIVEQIAGKFSGIQLASFGGYTGAERGRCAILPDFLPPDSIDWDLSVLSIRKLDPDASLEHGDYLGALTGLGVKRSKYGDISITDTGAEIIVTRDIFNFASLMLTQVGRVKVQTGEIPLEAFTPPSISFEERTFTVASPRLDAILSDAVRISRAKALEPIRAGKVQVNWRQAVDPAYELREQDVVSLRGYGRFRILEMSGVSKKGRLFVKIGKYM